MVKDELLKNLTPEQLAKVRSCKSGAEILEVAKREGVELTEEQLSNINGGNGCLNVRVPDPAPCPGCGKMVEKAYYWDASEEVAEYLCPHCGHKWETKF